jgi:hypothetical protein
MRGSILIAVLALAALLAEVPNAGAWYRYAYHYGGYGGGWAHYNTWTGGYYHGGLAGYNPYTGRYGVSRTFYNPYTDRYGTAQAVYNPYTNRYAWHYGYDYGY